MNRRNVLQAAGLAPVAMIAPWEMTLPHTPQFSIVVEGGRLPDQMLDDLRTWMLETIQATSKPRTAVLHLPPGIRMTLNFPPDTLLPEFAVVTARGIPFSVSENSDSIKITS